MILITSITAFSLLTIVASHLLWTGFRVARLRSDLMDMRAMALNAAAGRTGSAKSGCLAIAGLLAQDAIEADAFNVATLVSLSRQPQHDVAVKDAAVRSDLDPYALKLLDLSTYRILSYINRETLGGRIREVFLAVHGVWMAGRQAIAAEGKADRERLTRTFTDGLVPTSA